MQITRHASDLLNHKYPQNYILKKPLSGSLIFLLCCFIFMILYRPLKTHASLNLNYPATMAIYVLAWAASIYVLTLVIRRIPFFSKKSEWTFTKEILSVFLILAGAGITSYFMGFIMEDPANRWNVRTFLDSCKYVLFIGIFPFGFFTLANYRHLFAVEISQEFGSIDRQKEKESDEKAEKIQIISRLKKEELSFFANQLIYVESEGNYVRFHIATDQKVRTELIRNSISEIEQQLAGVPYFSRIHRAFIVNVKKVSSKKGNTIGYRLKLQGSDSEIPVSRQKIRSFDQLLEQYRKPFITENFHS